MSKYIKLEDAEKLLTNALRVAQGFDEPLEKSLVDLPTIEVSEDCISRADLFKTIDDNVSQQYSYTYETYGLDLWALFVRIVKNAPSVVPKTQIETQNLNENSNGDAISREYVKGICEMMLDEEMLGYMLGYIEDAPSVVPKAPSEDCISRQQAIDAVIEWYGCKPDDIEAFEEELYKAPSVIPKTDCDTCKWGEWYRNGRDITNMDDECGGCCSWNSKWTPKETETEAERLDRIDNEIEDAYARIRELTADTPQTTLCRECDDYAGDGMYCASNYLVMDFSTSRESCEADTSQTNIDKAKADIAEWSSWSKTYEAMCGAKMKGADDETI